MTDDETRGMEIRRAVMGDDYVNHALARVDEFTAPFQDFITRYAWGGIWTRPGLDRRTRSCITVAMLVALGRHEELAMHVRGAIRNGCTVDEIRTRPGDPYTRWENRKCLPDPSRASEGSPMRRKL